MSPEHLSGLLFVTNPGQRSMPRPGFLFTRIGKEIVMTENALDHPARRSPQSAEPGADPLPSWNDGPAKRKILDFVATVTLEGSPSYVPVPERIATFDNDGTLWCEQPVPVQVYFALDRVRELAPLHPEWATEEPFASLLKGDLRATIAGGEHAAARNRHGDPRGHDRRGVRTGSSRIGSPRHGIPRLASCSPTWSTSRCSNCSRT